MVVFIESNSSLGSVHSNITKVNTLFLEVVIVFKRQVPGVEMAVRRAVSLFEASVFLILTLATLEHSTEIDSGENSVMRDHMVLPVRFEIVKVLEASGIRVA